MKKIIIVHATFVAIIIIAAVISYLKYWNVAYVNGHGISRLSYIKIMEQQAGKQILDQMIDDSLVLNEGAAKGLKIDQKAINEELAKVEEKVKPQYKDLNEALVANNMTKADLEDQIRIKKIKDTLSASTVEITQAQIDTFLKDNKAMLPTGKTKDELNALAKGQLAIEANQTSSAAWLDALRKSAKIIIK